MGIDWVEAESAIDERLALQKRRDELLAEFNKDKTSPEVALRLINTLDQLGTPPQEIAATCEPAFQANPRDAALMAWLAQLSYRMGELKICMVTAKHAATLDPDDAMANYTLGQVLLYTGAFADGLKYAQRAWDVGQAAHFHAQIGRLYCILLARLKRWDEALKFQQERLAERPDDSQAVIDTADLMQEMGKRDEAEKLLLDAHKHKPRDTDLLFRIAVGYFENDDFAAARGWADKLLEVDAQHLEGWNLRSQIRFRLGDFEGALEDHAMIRELSKSMPLDQSFRASCFEAMGRKEDAIAALKQGIEEVKHWPDKVKQYKQHLEKLQTIPPDQQKRASKLGPNDPCWCGSGKKLKKCHG
ncbi:MAG: SEC-C domain-containing protein [Planctomycetes bacterium]|nr:SEC-C domain-containing protein [Planctomycetota bacterium]MCW8135699.1 SEC-C domain-containing protein [Planctomycetota bacterium]